ncbi:hypothetical protein Peur_017976 [Populus x canadensis]
MLVALDFPLMQGILFVQQLTEQLALVYLLNIFFYAQSFWASGLGYEEIYLDCILPHGHIILPCAI